VDGEENLVPHFVAFLLWRTLSTTGFSDEKELFLAEEGATQRLPPEEEKRLNRRAPAARDPRELDDLDGREDELDLENQLLLEDEEEEDGLDEYEDLEDE
jgi:hypothetical protein